MSNITMKEFLEAGVHFGHQTRRWNPKMKEYIYGERNGIYIIDLQKTLKLFKESARFVADLSREGKTILFVGTKRQAQAIAEELKPPGTMKFVAIWIVALILLAAGVWEFRPQPIRPLGNRWSSWSHRRGPGSKAPPSKLLPQRRRVIPRARRTWRTAANR